MMMTSSSTAAAPPAAIAMIIIMSVAGGGLGGMGGGKVGGGGAANWTTATVGVVTAVTVTPSEADRSLVDVKLSVLAAAEAAVADGAMTDAATCTLPELISRVMSAAVMPLPSRAVRLVLKAALSNASTVLSMVREKEMTDLYDEPGDAGGCGGTVGGGGPRGGDDGAGGV